MPPLDEPGALTSQLDAHAPEAPYVTRQLFGQLRLRAPLYTRGGRIPVDFVAGLGLEHQQRHLAGIALEGSWEMTEQGAMAGRLAPRMEAALALAPGRPKHRPAWVMLGLRGFNGIYSADPVAFGEATTPQVFLEAGWWVTARRPACTGDPDEDGEAPCR